MDKTEQVRVAGLDLLRVFAMLLIVISHVVQTLGGGGHDYVAMREGFIVELGRSTLSLQILALNILRYLGTFGNNMFMILTSWFLLLSDKVKISKIARIVLDNWVISIALLWVVYIWRGGGRFIACAPTSDADALH